MALQYLLDTISTIDKMTESVQAAKAAGEPIDIGPYLDQMRPTLDSLSIRMLAHEADDELLDTGMQKALQLIRLLKEVKHSTT
jgi:hypothetical protein